MLEHNQARRQGGGGWGGLLEPSKRFYMHCLTVHFKCPTIWNWSTSLAAIYVVNPQMHKALADRVNGKWQTSWVGSLALGCMRVYCVISTWIKSGRCWLHYTQCVWWQATQSWCLSYHNEHALFFNVRSESCFKSPAGNCFCRTSAVFLSAKINRACWKATFSSWFVHYIKQ